MLNVVGLYLLAKTARVRYALRHATRYALAVSLFLGLTALLTGCGGSSRAVSVISAGTPQLLSISVGPPNATLTVGLTQQYTATGVYSDGSKKDLSATVTWKSGAVNVATISAAGIATAVSLGSTTITATLGSVFGSTGLTVSGASLVSIDVTPSTPSIALGTQQQFTATGVYSDFTTQNLTAAVTWNSSTITVATITPRGLAVAVAPGTTTITATLGSVFGTTHLTIQGAVLVSIAITPANASIPKGATEALTATGTFSDGTTQNLTLSATWTSSNPVIVTVAPGPGTESATGNQLGPVTLTATFGGISGTTTLTVTAAALVSITVTPVNPSIAIPLTEQFIATGLYTDNTNQVLTATAIWTSSAPAVATISNAANAEGLAQTLTVGTTTISATVGTIAGSTTLTVTAAALVSIAITPVTSTISIGSAQQYVATGTYADGTTQVLTIPVTWISGTPTVAAISNAAGTNGLATGLAVGVTNITAVLGAITSNIATLTVASSFVYSLDFDRTSPTGNGVLYQFSVTPQTGDLVPLINPATGVATVATGPIPFALTLDYTGQYVYVANYNFGNLVNPGNNLLQSSISQYTKAANGLLTPMAIPIIATNTAGPNGITANPAGPYVYVAFLDGSAVGQYTIGAGGALVAMNPATVTAGSQPAAIAVNPAGTVAYVANFNSANVSQFTIQGPGAQPGSLVPLAAPVAAGSGPTYAAIDHLDRYLYVVNQFDNDVSQYTIQANGTLLPMLVPTIATDVQPVSITIDAAGLNVYVSNQGGGEPGGPTPGGGTVDHFTIAAMTGALTFADSVMAVGAASLAIDPSGHFAYVADRGGQTLSEFLIAADGTLTPFAAPNTTIAAGTEPDAVLAAH